MEISESAAGVLARAYDAAARLNPRAKVRVYRRKGQIETGFAEEPFEGDETVEHDGMILFVATDVGDGVLDTSEEHDVLVVRPPSA